MNDEIAAYISTVDAVCEATSFEQHCLWRENTTERGVRWQDAGHGYLATVGHLGEHPVCISLLTAIIQDRIFLFYHATSRVVDHDMVRAWLQENLPVSAFNNRGDLNHSDATNFWNLVR